ncbi:MAG: hypothetical protein AAF598_19345 [Bacteroidota bacterium]
MYDPSFARKLLAKKPVMDRSCVFQLAFAGFFSCLFLFSCRSPEGPDHSADAPIRFSSDRLGVIFYSDRSGGGDLYYFNLNDSTTERITSSDSSEYNPTWLPEIKKLYHLRQEKGLAKIISLDPQTGKSQVIGINPGFEERPDWTPDGARCIFNTKDSTGSALIIGDASAKAVKTVLRDSFFNKQARWSPDQQKIAFTSNRAGGQDLFILDLKTDSITNLTNSEQWEGHPEWTADGQALLAYRYENGNADIYQFDISGKEIKQITDTPTNELIAKPGPIDNWIAFGGIAANWELFITQSNAANAKRITDHDGFDGDPVWVW